MSEERPTRLRAPLLAMTFSFACAVFGCEAGDKTEGTTAKVGASVQKKTEDMLKGMSDQMKEHHPSKVGKTGKKGP